MDVNWKVLWPVLALFRPACYSHGKAFNFLSSASRYSYCSPTPQHRSVSLIFLYPSSFVIHMALSPPQVRGAVNSSIRIRWILIFAWIFALLGLLFAVLSFVLNDAQSNGTSVLVVNLLSGSPTHAISTDMPQVQYLVSCPCRRTICTPRKPSVRQRVVGIARLVLCLFSMDMQRLLRQSSRWHSHEENQEHNMRVLSTGQTRHVLSRSADRDGLHKWRGSHPFQCNGDIPFARLDYTVVERRLLCSFHLLVSTLDVREREAAWDKELVSYTYNYRNGVFSMGVSVFLSSISQLVWF